MFDAVRNNKKIIQIVLALIILPFAFWGVESYISNVGGGGDVATVGGAKISAAEFQQAVREQQDQLQQSMGRRADPAMFDSPEMRHAILDSLVQRRLLLVHANKAKLVVTDEQLGRVIASVPKFQEDGKFSRQRYESVLAGQGMTMPGFEAGVRQDLAIQQPAAAVGGGALPGSTAAGRWVAAQLEEREVSEVVLRPEQYLAGVKVAPDAVKAFYEANRPQFEAPEQLRAEYLTLSLDSLLKAVQVSPEEVRKAYDALAKGYDDARQKAETVLAEARKEPKRFAELARQDSQDPGSKGNGGDLGFFGRGMMVKPFEEAVFKMKVGEISGLVESDFGFHIIMLTGIRKEAKGEERQASHILLSKPQGAKSFEAAHAEIEARLKREAAAKKFADLATSFADTVYEQADSLQPAAEKFKLAIQQSDWLVKGGQGAGPLSNPKLLAALFADDAIKNKRNTEAVEVAPNVLIAARVLEHKPTALRPLETVAASIEKLLAHQEAAKLAAKDGAEKLARLGRGEKVELAWGAPRMVVRAMAPNLSPEALRMVFGADATKLPAYGGATTRDGYVLFRISQVKPFGADAADKPAAQAMRTRYARIVAEEEFSAWMAALRERYPVEINQSALEAKEK